MELPHFNTDEGVNFASGVEFFKPSTRGKRQVPNYPTFLLQHNTILITIPLVTQVLKAISLMLLHLGCTNNHKSNPFVYLLLV